MAEIVFIAAATAFAAWVLFLGGAEWLEGTIKSGFLIDAQAPLWHATGIKAYVAITWIGTVLWILLV